MRVRRGPKEVDWQVELAARSPSVGGETDLVSSSEERVRRVKNALWLAVRPLAAALSLAVAILGRHHVIGVALILLWVCLTPFDWAAARRRKRARKELQLAEKTDPKLTAGERVEFKLAWVSRDLRWFLGRPTDRTTYERWLNNATTQLERISPEVAHRWARPDLGRSAPTTELVTPGELAARRARLLGLYAEVATPQELDRMTADLAQAPSARAITSS